MPNQYKLVALDMDGTAYHSMGEVVTENIEPIIKTQETGTKVVFVTGRPLNAKANHFTENGFTKHESIAVGYNGALIYDFHKDEVLSKNPIERENVILAFKESYKSGAGQDLIWAYGADAKTVFLNKDITGSKLEIELPFFDGEVIQLDENNLEKLTDCFKLLGTNCAESYLDFLTYHGFEVANSKSSANAEINREGVNKGFGIKFLCERYGISLDEVVAIGDGKNDVPMLEIAGLSIAPSNANEVVKEIVKEVLPMTNVDGAVAFVLNKYFLNKGEN